MIARLQERGYSLAAMRDLFEAWDAGQDLVGVLDDPASPMLEEAPSNWSAPIRSGAGRKS